MKNSCKDCVFWKVISGFSDKTLDGLRGNCEKIIEEYSDSILETDAIIFGVGGHYDSVSVGKDFGCIHFKGK